MRSKTQYTYKSKREVGMRSARGNPKPTIGKFGDYHYPRPMGVIPSALTSKGKGRISRNEEIKRDKCENYSGESVPSGGGKTVGKAVQAVRAFAYEGTAMEMQRMKRSLSGGHIHPHSHFIAPKSKSKAVAQQARDVDGMENSNSPPDLQHSNLPHLQHMETTPHENFGTSILESVGGGEVALGLPSMHTNTNIISGSGTIYIIYYIYTYLNPN